MNQWVKWITGTKPEDDIPKIYLLTSVLSGKMNDDSKSDHNIKSWAQPLSSLKEILKNRCNLKGALVLSTYCWPYGLK